MDGELALRVAAILRGEERPAQEFFVMHGRNEGVHLPREALEKIVFESALNRRSVDKFSPHFAVDTCAFDNPNGVTEKAVVSGELRQIPNVHGDCKAQ